MADTYLGRWNRYIEKLFNVKGGPTVVDVNPSVAAVLQASNPPLEERYLVGIEFFGAGRTQTAVAANNSAAMIRNPSGSNVIVTMEKIFIASTTTAVEQGLYVAGSNPADLGTSVSNNSRADPRSRSVGSAVVSMAAPAADPATGFLQVGDFFGTSYDFIQTINQEIVLLPGIALRVVQRTPNLGLTWAFFWRERPLESSELT